MEILLISLLVFVAGFKVGSYFLSMGLIASEYGGKGVFDKLIEKLKGSTKEKLKKAIVVYLVKCSTLTFLTFAALSIYVFIVK